MKENLMLISEMSTHLAEVYGTLQRSDMNVVHVESTYDAKAGLKINSPAFILLDFDIKGANSLLDEIAFGRHFPLPYIIIAAAYANGNDRAAMLKRGADYCIEKPINVREVMAIVNAVRRRNKQRDTIEYKELSINTSRRSVTMRGVPVILTHKEYQVLCFLANQAGIILTKEEIYHAVWKAEYDPKSTNVSDQISSLRSKLGLSSKDKDYIRTVIGVGYCFGNIK